MKRVLIERPRRTGSFNSLKLGCVFNRMMQAPALNSHSPPVHLGDEGHCETEVPLPRTQHNNPGQHWNLDLSLTIRQHCTSFEKGLYKVGVITRILYFSTTLF